MKCVTVMSGIASKSEHQECEYGGQAGPADESGDLGEPEGAEDLENKHQQGSSEEEEYIQLGAEDTTGDASEGGSRGLVGEEFFKGVGLKWRAGHMT